MGCGIRGNGNEFKTFRKGSRVAAYVSGQIAHYKMKRVRVLKWGISAQKYCLSLGVLSPDTSAASI